MGKETIDCVKKLMGDNVINQAQGMYKYKEFWLTHCPMHPAELRGKVNIYGHTHHKRIEDPNYLSVCCEWVDYTPIDLNEVRRRVAANKEANKIIY